MKRRGRWLEAQDRGANAGPLRGSILLVLVVGAPAPAGGGNEPLGTGPASSPAPDSVSVVRPDEASKIQRASTAGEQLESARRTRTAALRATGDQRMRLRRLAAEGFRAVRIYFPEERELAAEASFRAACEFVYAGLEADALAEFEGLAELSAPPAWRCRAALELGHLHRRRGRHAAALDAYLRAASTDGAARSWRDDASLWAGKTHAAIGEVQQAQRLFAWMTEHTADVFTRIRAFDEWALTFVAADDLEGAAGVLARCRDATRAVASEVTERGERVRRKLADMRCITELERAVARRRRTVGDPSR